MPADAIIKEAKQYLASGTKELVLAGIDLGSYRDGAIRLSNLVESLLELADRIALPGDTPARVRVSSIEPQSITPAFIDLLASSEGRLCRHLHLPLQSGSTKVLGEMARPYAADQFEALVNELYERVPSLSLTTDIICGFPGESNDEFEETIELVRRCRFSKIHVFPYSRREGTPAAARADQVDASVKSKRAEILRQISDELREEDFARRQGTTELVLVEDALALTESYHEVPVPSGATLGDLMPLVL
jgi:threonylcarbamoyladenosine tRNA methylthiotransferase MtaB